MIYYLHSWIHINSYGLGLEGGTTWRMDIHHQFDKLNIRSSIGELHRYTMFCGIADKCGIFTTHND